MSSENDNKIGNAICCLRKRAGYTQKDLAERIGISDKTVSKWERGLGFPDISYLRKLAILLDTDSDSLLSGDVVHHDSTWSGILVLDDNPYGIGCNTLIYDKPLINYLLSYFLLVGIQDITVIGNDSDKRFIEERFGGGEDYGINLTVISGTLKDLPNKDKGNVMLIYGRCLLYGVDLTRFLQKAMINRDRLTMLVLPKKIGPNASHITFDKEMRVIYSEEDEPLRTQYDFSELPILFFSAELLASLSAEESVNSFLSRYALEHEVYVHMLDRGFVEIEINDWNEIQDASDFMRIIQNKCGMNVYCIEEVAWRRGFITLEQLVKHASKYKGTEYGEYILELSDRIYARFNG